VQGKVLRSAGVGLGMLFVVVAAGHPGAVSAAAAGPAWTAYVATAQGVDPIDTATNTAGDAISGHGLGPVQLAVTPDDSTVYVVNDTFSTVIPMDTANNTPGTPIPVGDDPYGIAVTPDGATVYVASQRSDTVAAIDTATNTVRATIPVAGEPTGVAITPDGKTVYVSDFEANTVTPDRHRHEYCGHTDSGRRAAGPARDHPGWFDGLRRRRRSGHGDPNRPRCQHRGYPDNCGQSLSVRVALRHGDDS
jgi:YVTN family beta-propeller protein